MTTLHLLVVITFISGVSSSRNSSLFPELDTSVFPRRSSKTGDTTCQCLTAADLAPFEWEDLAPSGRASLEGYVNNTEYGYGCALHDINTPACTEECKGCYQDWCYRSWCYVDPYTCGLSSRRSVWFPKQNNRYFSYATCGDINFFSGEYRIQSLENTTLRMAFNSNSGGWEGAYSKTKEHFVGPLEVWSGPAVDFVKGAAAKAKFQIELVTPPQFLWSRSQKYFKSNSSFDFCIFATTLGFVDVCVSQYTITDFRATTTDFIVLGTPSIYLIIQEQEKKKGWNAVKSQITTITEPFETTTWIILIFIVLPFFAILFVVHEFNVPGSVFKAEEQVVHYGHGEPHLLVREIRWYHHVPRVIVLGMMAVLQQDFAISVLSTGAQIHIIGFAFFTLTIVAVYTANLAAILTQRAAYREVKSLEDAINAGYRFCTERDTYFLIHKLHGTDPKAFIPDDDGLPGFNGRRNDVLNRIDNKKAAIDKNYCNAALSSTQDLVVLQAQGLLCDLKPVGVSVGQSFTGLPISGRVSEAILPLFIQLNNDALYRTLLHDLAPQSVCPVSDADFSNDSLSIRELSGIWIISFGFAILGLIVRVACPMLRRRSSKVRVEPVLGYDQFFNSYKRVDFETVESVEVKEESIRRRLSKSSKSAWVIEQASFVEEFSDDESSDDAYPGLRGRKKKADFGAGFCKTLQLSQATEGTLTLTPIPEYDHTSWTNNVCNTEPRRLPQMQEEQKISISPNGRIDVSIPPLGPSKKDTPRMGESYRGRRILNEKNLSAHII